METSSLRHILVTDWAKIENTPVADRRQLEVERWHKWATSLAEIEQRPIPVVVAQLKAKAREVAARQLRDLLTGLARDLAVSRAMGTTLNPPWQRRLNRLVQVTGLAQETVMGQVERIAADVQVVVPA